MSRTTSSPLDLDARENEGIDTCTTCPKLCRWACPVAEAEARETTSPWSLVTLGGLAKHGRAPLTALGDLPYHCTHCGACTEACLHKNDVPRWLTISRSRVLGAHGAPEAVREIGAHFGLAGNPYGAPLEAALSQAIQEAEVPTARPTPSGALVYLPGCTTLAERRESVTAFFRALALHGISGVATVDASSACCGLPLFWTGDLDGFRAHAQRYADRLRDVDTVIVHDPACAHALQRRYAEVGVTVAPVVLPVAEFFASRLGLTTLDEARAREGEGRRRSESIAYFDTCHLARGLGVVSSPRRLISRATGGAPLELPGSIALEADCCGAAGLLPASAPGTAAAMAEARIQAFRQTGAQQLAVMSPRCAAHLSRVDPTVEVVDVVTLLSRFS